MHGPKNKTKKSKYFTE